MACRDGKWGELVVPERRQVPKVGTALACFALLRPNAAVGPQSKIDKAPEAVALAADRSPLSSHEL